MLEEQIETGSIINMFVSIGNVAFVIGNLLYSKSQIK